MTIKLHRLPLVGLAGFLIISMLISGVSGAQYSASLTATTSPPQASPVNSPLLSQPILRTITQLAIPPLTQVDPQLAVNLNHGLISPTNNTPQPTNQSQPTTLTNSTLSGATNRTQQIGDTMLTGPPFEVVDFPPLTNDSWGLINVLINASLGDSEFLWFVIDDSDDDSIWDTVYIDANGDKNLSGEVPTLHGEVVTLWENNFTVSILNANQTGGDPLDVDLGLLSYYREGSFLVDMNEDQTLELLNFTLIDRTSNGMFGRINIDLDGNGTYDSNEEYSNVQETIIINGYYFELYFAPVYHNSTLVSHYHHETFRLDIDGDGVSSVNETFHVIFIDNSSINIHNVSCLDFNGDQNITQDEIFLTQSANFLLSSGRGFNFAWNYSLSANLTALSYFEGSLPHSVGQMSYVLIDADSSGVYSYINLDTNRDNSYTINENATLNGNLTIDQRLYSADFAGNGIEAGIVSETYYNGTLSLLDGDYSVVIADNNSDGIYNNTDGYAIKIDINNDGIFDGDNEGEFQVGSTFYSRDQAEYIITSVAADGSTITVQENTYESSSVWIFGGVSAIIAVIGIATFFKAKSK